MILFTLALFLSPELFRHQCASCHGDDARGTAKGPGLLANPHIAAQSAEQLQSFLQHGNPGAGMPAFNDLPPADLASLVNYLRSLNPTTPSSGTANLPKITWRAPQAGDWLTYNGNLSANRYSELQQVTTANVANLKLQWIFPTHYFGLETTPLAADGVLYFTAPNQVFAIDALTGALLWTYARPQTTGLTGDAKLGTNRGVALLNDKIFFVTDNAHLLALSRSNGALLWEVPMAEERQEYGGTIAPLIVDDNVIVGVAGADEGIRGFVAAFKASTGTLVWRRWTIPLHGEPGAETWKAADPLLGGGSTWLTGSYDPVTGTLYWPTGNPFPDSDDRGRPGDNLYTDSILALNAKTGELKWHYQFTPHDLLDRDATEPPVLVDTPYRGTLRHLLLHADRNGFFYVLDRTNGEILLAKPFLRRVDWAHSIGSDGRPVVIDPNGCPSDAANWSSTAFSPLTHLYYFLALEECVGKPVGYPDETGQRFLRAINIETGEIAWEVAQPGPARAKTWTGVLATAGGLVFYGKPNGGFDAVDQRTGETLWHFPTNVRMKAPPITFTVGGKQYVVVAAGPNLLCFAL
jgi:PQQ-dependent dehydrogenase (methanol/ethanol family)